MVSNVELYDDLNDPTATCRMSGNAQKRWWLAAICPHMPAVIAGNRRLDRVLLSELAFEKGSNLAFELGVIRQRTCKDRS
jgi:hypothetical protein